MGEIEKAENVIDDFVADTSAKSDAANVGRTAAMMFEGFAEKLSQSNSESLAAQYLTKAESLFRRRAERGVDENLDLATFLARRNRSLDAIEILEKKRRMPARLPSPRFSTR